MMAEPYASSRHLEVVVWVTMMGSVVEGWGEESRSAELKCGERGQPAQPAMRQERRAPMSHSTEIHQAVSRIAGEAEKNSYCHPRRLQCNCIGRSAIVALGDLHSAFRNTRGSSCANV
jgi:hypothetical protein